MNNIDYSLILTEMTGATVERPNKADAGTLSGHAAGEPFEKKVYQHLKEHYSSNIFKQHEFLNDLYLKHPKVISVKDRYALLESPTALFLLNRGNKATKAWSPENIFEERQSDTADILYYGDGHYNLIDVKTRNSSKTAQAPNIISAYKLAKACTYIIDNEEYDTIDIDYIEIDWIEKGDVLQCVEAHHGNLFKATPNTLYINWAAGMQVQFHVSELDQTWKGTRKEWATGYIKTFVESARHRIAKMHDTYVTPFLKYIE